MFLSLCLKRALPVHIDVGMAEKGSEGGSKSDLGSKGSEGGAKSRVAKDEEGKKGAKEKSKDVPENKCSICMEDLQSKPIMITTCNHKFHQKCILTWLNDKNTTCPMDRTNLAVAAIGDEIDTNEDTLAQRLNQTCAAIDMPDPKNGPYSTEIVFSTRPLAIEAPPRSPEPSITRSGSSPGPEQGSRGIQSTPGRGQGTGRGRQPPPRRQAADPVGLALMGIAPGQGGRARRSSPASSNQSRSTSRGIDPTALAPMSTGRGSRSSRGSELLPPMPMPAMEPEPHKMVLWFNNLRPQVELKNMSDQYNVIITQGNRILGVVPKRSKALLLIFMIVGPPGKSTIRGKLYPVIDTLTFMSNGIEKKLENDEEYKRFISNRNNKRSVAFVQRRGAMNDFILQRTATKVSGREAVQVTDGKSDDGKSGGTPKI